MLRHSFRFVSLFVMSVSLIIILLTTGPLHSDPCGMVPPIYTGPGTPISRIGLQQTYVFFDEGVESFVIRPGFKGKVDNFGMLIPFPSPPSLRKVPDSIFDQIAKAVDPPEVIINNMPVMQFANQAGAAAGMGDGLAVRRSQVTVLKKEAVGMYEVAVLEAGSADALKRWMDENQYQYPKGMDKVTEEYITEGWCFVAVKTKVGEKASADPRPGQRKARPEMPKGSIFDGNVQGLGFRFRTDELVVPMRLSAFNEGDLRNVVYLLTKGSKKIRAIPEEFVVRQLDGQSLIDNLTQPLPVRVIGGPGDKLEIPKWRQKNLATERNPEPHNGLAKQLFVSDVVAPRNPELTLKHEEVEKELLRIGEHFGLRGEAMDKTIESVSKELSAKQVKQNLKRLSRFTLTVVDGDFPREVLANQNLKFDDFQMSAFRNSPNSYDTKLHKAPPRKSGKLISHLFDAPGFQPRTMQLEFVASDSPLQDYQVRQIGDHSDSNPKTGFQFHAILTLVISCLLLGVFVTRKRTS